jgi:Asp-tRNA(Asn)/Glu-tRNA(Gln) amidotransferase A subunit family amidase
VLVDRRTLLLAGLAAVAARARPALSERQRRRGERVEEPALSERQRRRVERVEGPSLETLSDWFRASPDARAAGVKACLDRIRAKDGDIHAWVQVSPQPPTGNGPLSGIPFGMKDIVETKGLSTEYGSPIYKGRIGTEDAAIVRELRQRGGVLLGKTHTTSFAYRTPAPTRNPRNLAHTPGGSSSGSAAAVAAGMVPLAVGTQTGGSVLRPASFCGVTGFKPTFGWTSTEGVLPFAKSLDTLGFFAQTAADMVALWEALGHSTSLPRAESRDASGDLPLGAPQPVPAVEPEMAAAFQKTLARLRSAGVGIQPIDIDAMLTRLIAEARIVQFYEGAHFHEQRYKEYGARLADMGDLVREGLQIPTSDYEGARRFIAECRTKIAEQYKATPIILVPAAPGPAPRGLTSTGDSRMNAPWTALGTPAISIPMPVGSALPLGLQLTAAHGNEAGLLRTAVRLEQLLREV